MNKKEQLDQKIGSICGEVMDIYSGYLAAKSYHQRKYNRTVDNWKFYFALDNEIGGGQWPVHAVQRMNQQKRQMLTYNIAKVIVDSMAGGIMQVPYDPDFIPVDHKVTSLTNVISKAMYSDKELMDWNTTLLEMVVGGLVAPDAACKMVISKKYNELGNIGLEMCLPGSIVTDPYWLTWSSRDIKKIWKSSWYSASELIKVYPKAYPYVEGDIVHTKSFGDSYGSNLGSAPFAHTSGKWGNGYEVIEQYDVIEETIKEDFLITEEGEVKLPAELSDKDKPAWLDENYPYVDESNTGWQPENVFSRTRTTKTCYVRAICPAISHTLLLESGKTQVQVQGTPFMIWSASRHNGQSHAIMDSIKDMCTNINYWESMLTYKIQSEGSGGAQLVDRAGFATDAEFNRFRANKNIPTETFEVREGSLVDGKNAPNRPVATSQFPTEVYKNIEHMIHVILPSISKTTPASLGRAEQGQSATSGKLYEMMKSQTDQQIYTIDFGLRMFYNGFYEAYLLQAAQLYSSEGLPREFAMNKGRESITLNEPITLADGSKGIKNDASKLLDMRHKVVISEKQASPTQKRDSANRLIELVKAFPDSAILSRKILLSRAVMKLDEIEPDDKEMLKYADEAELELAEAQIRAQIAEAKAMAQQAGQAPPAPEGEVSPEGEPLPEDLENVSQSPEQVQPQADLATV